MNRSTTVPAISVFIITFNEIDHIEQAIRSVQHLDEVIVVDSGSTDGTVEAAQALGATVVHQDWLGYAKQKHFAMQLCRNQWCFNLDGDEVVPAQVLDEIVALIKTDQCDAIRVRFEDYFIGGPMHPSSHKRSIVRVYKKDKIEFPLHKAVHENVSVNGKVARIKGCINHYGYDSVAKLVGKQNKYSSLRAEEKYAAGKRSRLAKLWLVMPIIFLKSYFLRRMFLSGRRGFIHAVVEAMYAFLKEAKLLELTRDGESENGPKSPRGK
ncbi:glycosyltransferase family 2 protein [Neiella sp. HB171785]|uniref:Glycosyltransferase family 2 protein n=1 Tax=Neiella litorisoli TaxID=2771431 RepID=A0A8J6UFR6_9GAMM|nr:glycosyltransferase family 2 protein [Neiella litorisoli]MBD1389086.1 glycosyltransferase family 2 protein [Neiella litorisoli]